MAASQNLPQSFLSRKSSVRVLTGYGIRVRVERGHLLLEDDGLAGTGTARLARVAHGLKRLVVVGSDGFVTLTALRWLADQGAGLVMLERDGRVLAAVGPSHASDAHLRRAQALALESGAALMIAKELISKKLAGQERLVRTKLRDAVATQVICEYQAAVQKSDSLRDVRQLEARAAGVYWGAWRDVAISFPVKDRLRVPDHWRGFGARTSPLAGGSPRLAVNPANAILNYLYALLESEARLAAAAVGLDPCLGILHVDTSFRDSLALDLMEPVRPQVDAFVLDWIFREPLSRSWLFETASGNCRLMAPFAIRLSETAPTWGRAVAPLAEWVARTLWSGTKSRHVPATRLTQSARRAAHSPGPIAPDPPAPRPLKVCCVCGASVKSWQRYCANCRTMATRTPEAQAHRTDTARRQRQARAAWDPSSLPEWLNRETYQQMITPALKRLPVSLLMDKLGVSKSYARDVRLGRRVPHAMHWQSLAQLVGVGE